MILHRKISWYDSIMLAKNVSIGDLVRVINGYSHPPAPRAGAIGIVVDISPFPFAVGADERFVLVDGEPWRQNVADLEVIGERNNGNDICHDIWDDVDDTSISSGHKDIQELQRC